MTVLWHTDGQGKQDEGSKAISAGKEGWGPICGNSLQLCFPQAKTGPPPRISAKQRGEKSWLSIVGFGDFFKVISVLVEGTRQAEGRSREQGVGTKLCPHGYFTLTSRTSLEVQKGSCICSVVGWRWVIISSSLPSHHGLHFGGRPFTSRHEETNNCSKPASCSPSHPRGTFPSLQLGSS